MSVAKGAWIPRRTCYSGLLCLWEEREPGCQFPFTTELRWWLSSFWFCFLFFCSPPDLPLVIFVSLFQLIILQKSIKWYSYINPSTGSLGLFFFTHWITRLFHQHLLCEGEHVRLLNWGEKSIIAWSLLMMPWIIFWLLFIILFLLNAGLKGSSPFFFLLQIEVLWLSYAFIYVHCLIIFIFFHPSLMFMPSFTVERYRDPKHSFKH